MQHVTKEAVERAIEAFDGKPTHLCVAPAEGFSRLTAAHLGLQLKKWNHLKLGTFKLMSEAEFVKASKPAEPAKKATKKKVVKKAEPVSEAKEDAPDAA